MENIFIIFTALFIFSNFFGYCIKVYLNNRDFEKANQHKVHLAAALGITKFRQQCLSSRHVG